MSALALTFLYGHDNIKKFFTYPSQIYSASCKSPGLGQIQ